MHFSIEIERISGSQMMLLCYYEDGLTVLVFINLPTEPFLLKT